MKKASKKTQISENQMDQNISSLTFSIDISSSMDPFDPFNEVGNVLKFRHYDLDMIWTSNVRPIQNPRSEIIFCLPEGKGE